MIQLNHSKERVNMSSLNQMNFFPQIKAFIDRQYRCPHGPIGQIIGMKMIQQHKPELDWTISLLEIDPTDSILEVGFGGGKAVEQIASSITSGHIWGIDLSSTMVGAASRRNSHYIQAGTVELCKGDIMSLPFADQQFDKIFSIHSFYFWSDPLQAFREIYRVLKPQGKVIITLSPGIVSPSQEIIKTPLIVTINEKILPYMEQLGFVDSTIQQGPNSRQFATIAIVGIKKASGR
jgi:ubiquinone/menaquinone biosynthesis C-methylase UbiE